MKNMVLNDESITSEKRHQFTWDNNSKDIITRYIDRSVKSTISEKRNINGYDTLPFGYQV